MKRKVVMLFRALVYALLGAFVVSCGEHEIKKVNVDNSFAISLFADTIVIGDLISRVDSSFYQFIKVSENGDIYAYYADSVNDAVKAQDVFSQIPDVNFDAVQKFDMPEIPTPPVPIPYSYTFDELFSMPFSYDGYSITSVVVKEGDINIDMKTDMNFIDTLVLFTNNIVLENGKPLEIMLLMDKDVQKVNIPLAKCRVVPIDGKLSFGAKIAAMIEQGVGGEYSFDVDGSINNLDFLSIDGSIDDMNFDFVGSQPISFGFKNLVGDFKLVTPDFNIKYHNSFGFKAEGVINELYLTSSDGSKTELKQNDKIYIELHNTYDGYDVISDLDDQLVEQIDVLGDYSLITFNGDITVGCDELKDYLISDNSHIDVIADLTLPLKFNINELCFRDTIDFDINLSDEDMEVEGVNIQDVVDELEFKLLFKNKLPFQITPQVYMMYQDYIIDSLFVGNTVVHGCFDGIQTEDVLTIIVSEDKLNSVQLADKLCIDLKLSSLGNTIIMNTNDYFDLRIGIKTKTTEINVENINF